MTATHCLGKFRYFFVVVFAILFLSSLPSANAAEGTRLEHRRISSSLSARSKACTSNAQCSRNAYCSNNICQRLKAEGSRCSSYSDCFSGSCDTQKGTCQSSNLSLGSKCSSSATCKSGNCQNGYCLPKLPDGASCYKTANCASGHCASTMKKCFATGTGSDRKSELQPTLPFRKDSSDLSNLKPTSSIALYFTNSGVLDQSISQLFATSQTDFSNPAIILSHSSLIKQPHCSSDGILEIPFINEEAYSYAKKEWQAVEGDKLTLVTHSDGCGTSSSEKTDERTYWTAQKNEMTFDDDALTIDLIAVEIGHEDAIGGMDIVFGGTDSSSSTSFIKSSGDGNPVTSALCGAPTSDTVDGLPAAKCGTDFDKTLDASNGYYDLTNVSTLGQDIHEIAPGMDDNASAYEYETSISASSSTSSKLRRRRIRKGPALHRKKSISMIDKRGFFSAPVKFFKKVGSTVVNVAQVYVSVAKSGIAAGLAQTPLATLPSVQKYIQDNPFVIDNKIPLDLKISDDKLTETDIWGRQFKLFETEIPDSEGGKKTKGKKKKGSKKTKGDKKTTKTKSAGTQTGTATSTVKKGSKTKIAATTTPTTTSKAGGKRANKKSDAKGESELTGSLSLYCVNCNVTGNAVLSGRVAFKTGGLQDAFLQVNGALLASAFLGLEAEAAYKFEKQVNILTIPLGGFSIRDSVVIGPAAQLDAQFKFDMNAEGNILVGGTFELPDFKARLDLLSEKAFTQSGFTPQITKKFDITGEVTAEASLGLPLTVLVGVKIKPLKFDKSVGLTTEPAIGVSGKYLYDNTVEKGEESCNGGFNYTIGVSNDISINFLGKVSNLHKWKKKLVEPTCLRISADPGKEEGDDGEDDTQDKTSKGDAGEEDVAEKRSLVNDRFRQRSVARSSIKKRTLAEGDFGTFSQSSQEIKDGLAAEETSGNSASKDLHAEGFKYVQMSSKDKTMLLAINNDGNFVPQDANTNDNAIIFMATTSHVVVTNPSQDIFVYYPQEMAMYNASRVRAVSSSAVPKSADTIAFVPINDDSKDSTDGTYIAISTDGKAFLPVMCNFANSATSKLFLVDSNSIDSGIKALEASGTQNTVTGDVISGCIFFNMISSGFAGLA